MAIDHSATYRVWSFKNLVARHRLRTIFSIVENDIDLEGRTYADVGCSNGYLTALISDRFKPSLTCGYDHNLDNLEIARTKYSNLKFDSIDLNGTSLTARHNYDVVTCFEVLEHVGNMQNALDILLNMTAPSGGVLFLTVPIEVGWRGTLKFLIKTVLYRYDLGELPPQKQLYTRYLGSLLANKRMGRFRDRRLGWGTHFGFDYRDVDDLLTKRGNSFKPFNLGMSRFYLVRS